MVQFSRYRGLALVLLGLAISLAVIDGTLTVTLGPIGRFLPGGEEPTDTEVYSAVGGRISWILDLPRCPGIGGDRPLGVLFGQSTLGAGVDPLILEELETAQGGSAMCWVNLHGWGGSINKITPLADLFLASGLKPDVAVLAINPYMLVGHRFDAVTRHLAEKENKRWRPYLWIYNNRFIANHLLREAALRVKIGLMRQLHVDFRVMFPAAQESWTSHKGRPLPEFTTVMQAERAEYARAIGWFDAEQYALDSSNARALVRIIRKLRELGSRVCIVLMPEHSGMRAQIPARAVECLSEMNRADFPNAPVPVYNLRDRMKDCVFRDFDHLGYEGCVFTTCLVGQCVRDLLSERPDPERLLKGLDVDLRLRASGSARGGRGL
jgi:hypothetical protein